MQQAETEKRGAIVCSPRKLSATVALYASLLTLCLPGLVARAATLNVPADYDTIQDAIDVAKAGDHVVVAPGEYLENINFIGKPITVRSTAPADPTVVAATVIHGSGGSAVVGFDSGEGQASVLSGLTITHVYTENYGCGILCYESSPTINNNIITENQGIGDGGGIYCAGSSPTIANNIINDNIATSGDSGGGICCDWDSSPEIINNRITGNRAGNYGGGIYCTRNSSPHISNNDISGNSASWGGGIACDSASPTISNNTIDGNSALADFDQSYGGGIHCRDNSRPTISSNSISGNSARYGGGISCLSCSPTISNNIIERNSGKAVRAEAYSYGGGIYCSYCNAAISNNTISGNSASEGGGIRSISSQPTICNCIIAFSAEGRGLYVSGAGTPLVRHSDLYGNIGGDYGGMLDLTDTDGNTKEDPLFADAAKGDYHLRSLGGRWDPNTGTWVTDSVHSPCIDAGDPTSDYTDEPAPNGGRVNMGAYGNTQWASKSWHTVTITDGPTGAPNPVASGDAVACSVTAEDSLGHDLAYTWTATDSNGSAAGRFDDFTKQNPTWTAPNTSEDIAEYTIEVTATCSQDATVTSSAKYTQMVRRQQAVEFADENLEAAVREAINKPTGDIYEGDLHGLIHLSAENAGISDLSGLEYCTDLERIELDGNQISDLQPLAGLGNLVELSVPDNQISDLQALAGLINLDALFLNNNQISDVQPLAGLTNLEYLFLANNQISDLQPLAGLTNLEYLCLDNNQISDVQPLAGLTNLLSLNLSHNQISGVPTLAGLANLIWLNLSYNQISDLQGLAGLANLMYLYLHNNQISDLQGLAGLTNLDTLFLSNNQISHLQGLAGLANLECLYLDNNQISDLQLVTGLTKLRAIKLSQNQISDIGPLVANTGLGMHDGVKLEENWLDLSEGSQASADVQALRARGVIVYCDNQQAPPPAAPSNLNAQTVNDGNDIKLTWQDNSSNEDQFKVERRRWVVEGGWSQWTAVHSTGPNVTEFLDDAIPVGSSYQYRVQALNNAGASAWTESWGIRCQATPLWPVGLTAQEAAAGDRVELSWRDKSAVEEGFDLERRQQNPDGTWPESWTALASLPADTQAYSDDTIAEEGMYEYRIRAYNALGSSEWSLTAEMPWSGSGLPAGPSGVNGHAVNDGTAILVSWQDHSSTETGFKVQRRRWLMTGGWSEWTTVLWTAPSFLRFVDDSLSVGSSYQYRVRAVNAAGFSAWAVSGGIRCEPTPLWPDNLQAELVHSGQDVKLTWTDKSSKENNYKVRRRQQLLDGSYSDWTTIAWLAANSTVYTDNQLPADGWYEYRVWAVAGTGAAYGGPVGIARESTGPLPPIGFSGQVVHSGCDVALSWVDRSASELYLKVQRRAEVSEGIWSEWTTVVWLASNRTSWLDDGLPGDGNYEYRAQTFNAQGTSEWSQVARITRAAGAGGAAALSVASLNVTQVNGQCASIVYNLSAAADVSIEVRNIAGRLVRAVPCGEVAAGINTATWNLRNSTGALVPSGRYLCTLTARCADGTQASTLRTLTVQR